MYINYIRANEIPWSEASANNSPNNKRKMCKAHMEKEKLANKHKSAKQFSSVSRLKPCAFVRFLLFHWHWIKKYAQINRGAVFERQSLCGFWNPWKRTQVANSSHASVLHCKLIYIVKIYSIKFLNSLGATCNSDSSVRMHLGWQEEYDICHICIYLAAGANLRLICAL